MFVRKQVLTFFNVAYISTHIVLPCISIFEFNFSAGRYYLPSTLLFRYMICAVTIFLTNNFTAISKNIIADCCTLKFSVQTYCWFLAAACFEAVREQLREKVDRVDIRLSYPC
jgi:hypothetical protein